MPSVFPYKTVVPEASRASWGPAHWWHELQRRRKSWIPNNNAIAVDCMRGHTSCRPKAESTPPPREPASFVAMTLVLQSMTEYGVDDAGLDYRLIMMLAIILGFVFGCLFFRVWPRTYASAAWRHKKYGCGGLLARGLIYLSLQTRLVTRRKRHDVCVERASVSMPQQSIRPAGYYS